MENASVPQDEPIEEQTLPRYAHKRYYPVRIGEKLNDRYSVLSKLGFGASSTVWLARDDTTLKYKTIKIFVQDDSASSPVLNEVRMMRHIQGCLLEHNAAEVARLPQDIFEIEGPSGLHYCMVFEPQSCSLWTLRHKFPDCRMPGIFVGIAIHCLMACVNWLDYHCNLVHTEITTQNVLAQAANDDQFEAIEREESREPSVPIIDNGYPVYRSRGEPQEMRDITSMVRLTDFGAARDANIVYDDWVMPDTYRAPEVLMGVLWNSQIDIWSIGIMALELIEGRNLFDPIDRVHSQYVLPLALAQYISVLGLPPLWMIKDSNNPHIPTFFDEQGQWTCELPIPDFSLENWITALPPGDEKDKFIKFVRRILVWDSDQRATSGDLFTDEWFS